MSAPQLTTRLIKDLAVTAAKIANGTITNTQIDAAAAIAYSKLNLTGSIVNADVNASAAIAYSKLALTGSIVNADISASAAIAYSKLSLTGSIVNADISASAAIAYSKLSLTGSIVVADIASGAKDTSATANTLVLRDANGRAQFADPSAAQDAATKAYVDSLAQGLDTKASVRAATTAALPSVTYSANVLTAAANGALAAQDGVTLVLNDRLLVKNQAAGLQNGLYYVSAVGDGSNPFTLTRTTDADNTPSGEVTAGLFTFVEEGTLNADTGWVLSTNGTITLGTTALAFTQFSSAGVVTAGAELTQTGNTIAHKVQGSLDTAGQTAYQLATVTVNAYGHVTAAVAKNFTQYGGTASGGETTAATTANIVPNSEVVVVNGARFMKSAGHYTVNNSTGLVTFTTALEAGDEWEVTVLA